MVKSFDPSKFRKSITKSLPGISAGFHDPKDWVDTGNYVLNYLISGDFHKGIPLGKVTCFAGESGAGKSYIAAGNLVRNAQEQGIFVVLLDSENALDEKWLHAIGVDTSEEKLLRLNVAMVDEVAKILADFVKEYQNNYGHVDEDERPKVLFVIDSLGMLLTPTDTAQFEKGDMKGDLGRKAKSLTALVRNSVNRIAQWNIGLVVTNHTYASQDMFDPDDKISGGQGFIYASSIVVAMKRRKLKEDEDGNKISSVRGIRAACKVMKSRYAKPYESVEVHIPFDTGMDPYSGMFDMLLDMGILEKVGNKYKYVAPEQTQQILKDGVVQAMLVDPNDREDIVKFKKEWKRNDEGCLDTVMKDFPLIKKSSKYNIDDKANAHEDGDNEEVEA